MLHKDKVVLITGAARGIGKVSALTLAEEGADVAVVDILPEVEETAREIEKMGRRSTSAVFDISDVIQVKDGIGKIKQNLGETRRRGVNL